MSLMKLIWDAITDNASSAKTLSIEDIIVAAWLSRPDKFGLPGYSDRHPDSRKVSSCIFGRERMIDKGYLIKVGPNQYRLGTDPGTIDHLALQRVAQRRRALTELYKRLQATMAFELVETDSVKYVRLPDLLDFYMARRYDRNNIIRADRLRKNYRRIGNQLQEMKQYPDLFLGRIIEKLERVHRLLRAQVDHAIPYLKPTHETEQEALPPR